MSEDDPENPYTLTGRQVVVLFAVILVIAVAVVWWIVFRLRY